MASGLPSVVTAIPANLQLIEEGVHGLTMPFGNEKAAGQAFMRCFADPEMRRRLGAAARRRVVENYSTERVVKRYEDLFADIIAAHASVPGIGNML
jgi:glycosyltransferase involved in cell wall biosynthesis